MGTSANIYIKTEKETLKYNVSKDGGFSTLGIYLLGKLHYHKDNFLQEFDENDMFDFEDKYQDYVYHIDFEKTSMSVFEVQNGNLININDEAITILENERRDLLDLIEIQISLNIGTIYIEDPEVIKFIQSKSIDEIKKMFIDYLSEQVKLSGKIG